jgi:cardiolipin synthase C
MWWIVAIAFIIAALVAVAIFGRFSAPLSGLPSSALAVSYDGTVLDRAIAPILVQNPGKTGLRLLTDNIEAFAVRAATTRNAERSLDLQYYYWKDDLTGGLLANEVIKAADRGVRVRLLLDDINAWGRDSNYRAVDTHPNVEVRLFNPIRCREGAILRGIEMILRFWSVNRRMHHKIWIADGRVAIAGGRNIGDAYFDASEASNFRDMDLLILGRAARQAEEVFDRYWNCAMVAPIRNLAGLPRFNLARLRQRLNRLVASERAAPYLERLQSGEASQIQLCAPGMHWTDRANFISDPPEKAATKYNDSWLLSAILPVLRVAQKSVEITSPYFIPLDSGARLLLKLAHEGVTVSVLTNSLAATDVTAVHGSYIRFRKPLLAGGVRLFELRPRDAKQDVSLFGSRGASLHTKALVVDSLFGFVGTFNFDPRSVSLNTEMGLLFEHAELAREMQAVFTNETNEKRSYKLQLSGDFVQWQDGRDRILHSEPEASLRRRIVAGVVSLMPVESQL